MAEKEYIGVRVDKEKKERIESQLEYGDSLSEWVREAIDQRLERDEDEQGNPKAEAMTAD
jgi:Arc/MetJ-type ribon-helix-helix transcriptional regulator